MIATIERTATFALYQLSLLLGLLLLPVALLARRGGLTIPIGQLVERTRRVHASARNGR